MSISALCGLMHLNYYDIIVMINDNSVSTNNLNDSSGVSEYQLNIAVELHVHVHILSIVCILPCIYSSCYNYYWPSLEYMLISYATTSADTEYTVIL